MWHWHNLLFWRGWGGVGSMCTVYVILEQLLTWLLQLYFSEVFEKAVFSMMSKIPELKHSLHLTWYKSIWRLPLPVQDGYCNTNLQLPCILFVGPAYRYLPATAFNIFSQQIYLLNFFKHSVQSLFFFFTECCIFHNVIYFRCFYKILKSILSTLSCLSAHLASTWQIFIKFTLE